MHLNMYIYSITCIYALLYNNNIKINFYIVFFFSIIFFSFVSSFLSFIHYFLLVLLWHLSYALSTQGNTRGSLLPFLKESYRFILSDPGYEHICFLRTPSLFTLDVYLKLFPRFFQLFPHIYGRNSIYFHTCLQSPFSAKVQYGIIG